MRKIIAAVTIFTVVIVLLVISTEFVRITIKQNGTHRVTVDQQEATFVNTLINIPTGTLTLMGDADKLFEGQFTYEEPQWDARAAYSVENGIGSLNVIQPITFRSPASVAGYDYQLSLNHAVPMALDIERMLGRSDLTLDDLHLSSLVANLGSDDDTLRLHGDQPDLAAVNISTGQGKDDVAMDCTCAVLSNVIASLAQDDDTFDLEGSYPELTSINVDGSLGDDAVTIKGDYPTVSTMTLNLGAGSDTLNLNGTFPQLNALIANVGTGDDIVNLTGSWSHNLSMNVISELNTTTLELPSDVGVYVEIFGQSAHVKVNGLTAKDKGYVNAAYGTSPVTLTINLNTSSVETVTLNAR